MDGDTVLYRFNGVCGVNVPFSGSTRANVSKMDTVNTISFVGNAALSAYDLVSGIYKASNASTKTAASQGVAQAESGGKSLFSSGLNYVTNAISVPQVTSIRGGTSGDLSSFGEGFNCILVCEFCNPVISTGYSHIQGRPLMKVKKISKKLLLFFSQCIIMIATSGQPGNFVLCFEKGGNSNGKIYITS